MKIAHICLSCFYIDGHAYQENELVRQHVEDGHEVTVIASTEVFDSSRRLNYVEPRSYDGQDGALVIRLPYRRLLPHKLMRKLRMHPGVIELLRDIKPEVVLFHGMCGWEMIAVTRYKRENPDTRLYVDSHEDWNNSARNWISKNLLHKLYYGTIIRRCQKWFDEILCVSLETMDFVEQVYGVPRRSLQFFPLGGRVYDDEEYISRRKRARDLIDAPEGRVLFLQTGKMGRRKKVIESLNAFKETAGEHLRFLLVGSLSDDVSREAKSLIDSDDRIVFLGWKSSEDLSDLLCAADVYVQPGTQSATMQMSLCARCPVIVDDVPSHVPYVEENGWKIHGQSDLEKIFADISRSPEMLEPMSEKSLAIARRLLDYRQLAARIR